MLCFFLHRIIAGERKWGTQNNATSVIEVPLNGCHGI